MIFDTHCHYNLEPLSQSWQTHWQTAQLKGVLKSVVVGTNIQTTELGIKIASQEKNLWATAAIHPIEYNRLAKEGVSLTEKVDEYCQQLKSILEEKSISKLVAVGETGLDYFHLRKDESLLESQKESIVAAQKASLNNHVQLAQNFDLPLILHVRDQEETAYWDTLAVLDQLHYQGKFVLHCVSGPEEYVQQALEMDAYIGAAGNSTYKNAETIRELLRLAPPEKILVETDAPYLPPQVFRGKVCEPWMITHTADFLTQQLNIPQEILWQNAHTFFHLE
jgi:TatD DNase family protein